MPVNFCVIGLSVLAVSRIDRTTEVVMSCLPYWSLLLQICVGMFTLTRALDAAPLLDFHKLVTVFV